MVRLVKTVETVDSVSSDGMVSSSNNNAANGTSDPAVTSTSKPVPAIDKSSEKRQTSNSTVRPEPSLIEGLASDITFGQPTSLGRVPDRIASKCFIPNNARQINKSSFASSRPVQHSHNLKDPVDMMNATFLSMPANPIIKTGQPPNQQVFSSRTPTNTSDTGRSLTEIRGNYSTDHKYTPLDAAQANQNIKSLLEGAFDDNSDDEGDDDIPKDKNKEFTVDEDDLIGKLQQMSVKTKEEGVDVASRVGLTAPASTEDGLNVRLMPHQVDGVAWMVQKEKGGQKKRGASINGGILADDVSDVVEIKRCSR